MTDTQTHTRNQLALFVVCAPKVTDQVRQIAGALGKATTTIHELTTGSTDRAAIVTGGPLDVARWRHAASEHQYLTCVLSVSAHNRSAADISAWPRMVATAITEAHAHVGALTANGISTNLADRVHSAAPPTCVRCDSMLDPSTSRITVSVDDAQPSKLMLVHDCAAPTLSDWEFAAPPEAAGDRRIAPSPAQRTLFESPPPTPAAAPDNEGEQTPDPDRPRRSEASSARLRQQASNADALHAWTVKRDGSCCEVCPLCGADVHHRMGWHLNASGGHSIAASRVLSQLVRAHLRSHIDHGWLTEELDVTQKIIAASPFGRPA